MQTAYSTALFTRTPVSSLLRTQVQHRHDELLLPCNCLPCLLYRYNHNQVPNPYSEGIFRNCASVWCVRIPQSKVQFRWVNCCYCCNITAPGRAPQVVFIEFLMDFLLIYQPQAFRYHMLLLPLPSSKTVPSTDCLATFTILAACQAWMHKCRTGLPATSHVM